MARVAGFDSTPGGWSVVFHESGQLHVRKAGTFSDIVDFVRNSISSRLISLLAFLTLMSWVDVLATARRGNFWGCGVAASFPRQFALCSKPRRTKMRALGRKPAHPMACKSANRPTPLCRRSNRLMIFFRNGQNSAMSCGRCILRCASANWQASRCDILRASSQVERKGNRLFTAASQTLTPSSRQVETSVCRSQTFLTRRSPAGPRSDWRLEKGGA